MKIGSKEYKGKLVDGKVTIKLPKFHRPRARRSSRSSTSATTSYKRAHKFINLWVVRG